MDSQNTDADIVLQLVQTGMNIVEAVNKVTDISMRARSTIAPCHDGCSNCCWQLIGMLQVEWDYIEHWISKQNKGLRKEIIRNSKPAIEWLAKHSRLTDQEQYDQWDGSRPCPFLKNDRCLIYDARPPTCRLTCSLTQCEKKGAGKSNDKGTGINVYACGAVQALLGRDPRFKHLVPYQHERPLIYFMAKSSLYSSRGR